ncbi:MAG: hypothetical protein HY936_07140 [Nitrosomonadales bacterium]|nr:hypothetical protein [Nitrosomonadales bacterium]
MNATLKTGNCGTAKKLALAALLLAATIANAEDLGRLFFTPEQRAQLEQGKLQHTGSDGGRRALTVNGIVQKHGGPRTVWINGVPQPDGVNDDRAPESLLISTPVQSEPVKVKVGQRVLINPPASERPVSQGQ